MSRIEESISKLKRFKYHAIGRLELEDAIDNVVSWYEQMLKDAVEYKIVNNLAAYPIIYYEVNHLGLKYGDKVRIVVLKEEDE